MSIIACTECHGAREFEYIANYGRSNRYGDPIPDYRSFACSHCRVTEGAEPCEFHSDRPAEHKVPNEKMFLCSECWQTFLEENE